MDLQDPTRKMSTTAGSEQGTVYVLDEPSAIEKKIKSAVTDSGTEIRRAADKPGVTNLIEILAVARASTPEEVEARDGRRARLRRPEGGGRGGRRSPTWRRCASATPTCAPTRTRSRRCSRTAPRGRGRSPPRRSPTCASGWAWARPVGADRYREERDAPSPTLDLDLDVFSGPFDLLLTLVLREEIDLLELALADVVLSYLDHLESRGELDLETATEFIVLIAALLGAEVQADARERGRRRRSCSTWSPRRPRRSCSRGCSTRAATAPPPATCASCSAASTACASAKRPRPRTCAAPSSRRRRAPQNPEVLGAAIGRLLSMPPTISLRHIGTPRVTVAERLAHLRGLLRRGAFSFDEAVGEADRMTVAVTLFALLELYKRGEVDWRQPESFGEIAIQATAAQPGATVAAVAG